MSSEGVRQTEGGGPLGGLSEMENTAQDRRSHRTSSAEDDPAGQFEGMHPTLYRGLQTVIARIPGLRLITISNAFGLPVVRGEQQSIHIWKGLATYLSL